MPLAPTQRPVLEEFEPRILYAADLAAVVQGLGDAPTAGAWQTLATTQPTAVATQEIAFVDLSLPDAQTLVAGLQAQKEAGRTIDIVTIAPDQDGLAVIAQALEGRSDLSAIHLLGHGSDGVVRLGSVALDSDLLLARAGEIADWSRALTAEADVLIYGCDVAASEAGRELVQSLAALSGADVAASDDATGSVLLGGDWVLEQSSGSIEAASAADAALSEAYAGVLGNDQMVNTTTASNRNLAAIGRGVAQAVASDALGRHVVVWTGNNQDGSGLGVFARRFASDGTPLSGEIAVNTFTAGDQTQARVVSDATGNFVVAWSSEGQDGSNTGIVFRRFAADGTPLGGEQLVNTTLGGAQTNPVIGMNRITGDFVVAWEGMGSVSGSDTDGIWFRRFAASGVALDAADRQADGNATGVESNPAVGMDASGRVVVAWERANHVHFQRFAADGSVQGGSTQVDNNVSNSTGPALAMADDGDFTLVYREQNILPGVWGRSYDADGMALSSWFYVDSGDASSPSAAVVADGKVMVAYHKSGIQGLDVFGRLYDVNGSPIGAAFVVNQTTNNEQQFASVTALDTGHYVVAWSGWGTSDSNGVHARVLDLAPLAPSIGSNGGGASAGVTVDEATTAVTTVTAADPNADTTLMYSIIGGADAARFGIDAGSGVLRFLLAPDRENPVDAGLDNVYDVTVQVSDGALTDTQALAVTVRNVNEGPVTSADAYATNAGSTLTVSATAGLLINDTDPDGDVLSVRAIGAPAHGSVSLLPSALGAFTNLTNQAATDTRPAWSPDGMAIAFDSARDGNNEIYRMNADGSGLVRLTNDAGDDSQAAWSPDGGRIAFMSNRDGNYDLWLMQADGSGLAQLAATSSGVSGQPAWSPDGSRIAFTSNRAGGQYELWVVNVDGSGLTRLTNQAGNDDEPVWSPDGTRLAFTSARDGNAEIYVMNADGSGQTRLTSDAALDRTPDWSNDGTTISFISARSGVAQIVVMDVSGANPVIVSAASTAMSFADLAPDGRSFVFSHEGEIKTAALIQSGGFVYTAAPDFSGVDSFSYRVVDPVGHMATGLVSITVNGAPVITSDGGGSTAALSIAENTTAVTTVVATDGDLPAQTLVYSIAGGADAARFAIDAATGALRFVSAPDCEMPADAGADNVYDLVVQVSDGSLTDVQAIAVSVLDSSTGDVLLAIQDTYIAKGSALNHGQATSLVLDKSGGSIGDSRVLLQFDLSAIPADATITGATLEMTSTQNGGALNLGVYRLTAPWTEGDGNATPGAANWTERSPGSNWLTAGGDFDPTPVATLNSGSTGLHLWDLTALVANWVQGNLANDGIVLGSPDGGGTTVTYGSAESANPPRLLLSFTLANAPPTITAGGGGGTAAFSVAENSIDVTTVTATDGDLPAQTLSYSIAGGADATRFMIDAASGLLRFAAAPDAEAPADANGDNVYQLIVQVSDGAGGTDQQTLDVTVTGLNDAAPVITSNGGGATASVTAPEGSTAVTTVTASDADLPAQALSYAIVGGSDAALFAIDVASGLLRFAAAPDFEAPADAGGDNVYEVVVEVSDGTLVDTQAFTIAIANVIEAPVPRSDSAGTLAGQTVVVDVLANDSVDASRTLQLLDVRAPAHGSAVVAGDQVIYTPDAGWTGSDTFRYRITDGSEGLAQYWRLDGDAQAAVGTADGSLVNGPVTVDGAWGQALDFDGINDHVLLPDLSYTDSFTLSFWFRLDDNAGTGYRHLYAHGETALPNTLNVFVIEDGTAMASGIQGVIRTSLRDINDADDLSGLDVPVAGLADGNWHQYTLSVQTGTGAQVYIDGTARAASTHGGDALDPTGPVVLGGNSTLSSIRFLDGSLDGLALHDHALTSAEVAALPSGATAAALTVITSSSAPLAVDDAYTLDEDSTLAALPGVLSNDLANGSGVLTAGLVSGPAHAASFALRADGSFDYVPLPDFQGSDSFSYRAWRDGLNSGTAAVSLTVTGVNDAPVITHAGGAASVDLGVPENTPVVATLAAADIDTATSALRWSVVGGADAARFVVDAASGLLRFASPSDADAPADADGDGIYVVTLAVDDGSLQDQQTLRVTVSDVDEFDVGASVDIDAEPDAVAEDATPGTTVGLQVRAVDADATLNTVTYALTDSASGRFAIDANSGTVTVAGPLGEFGLGPQSIEVEARSADGSSARTRFTIAITLLNDNTPSIVSNGSADRADLVVDEGTTLVTRVQAVDADLPVQALNYRIAGGADAAAFVMDAASGELRFAVAPDAEAIADPARRFEVLVEASDGLSVDWQWLSIGVSDVDEVDVSLPVDTDATAEAVAEDAAVGTSVGLTVRAVDADIGTNSVSYSLDDSAAGRFAIDPQSGVVSVGGPLDHEAQTAHSIVVRATSADGSWTTHAFAIAVTPVNEAAPRIVAPTDAVIAVPEGTNAASDILRLVATDADLPASPITFSLVGGADAGLFTLDAASGALRFLAAPDHEAPVDADGNNRYEITVRASDGERWTDRSWVVVVGNVNESPQAGAVDLGRTNEDRVFEFGAAELLAASSDPDGDSLAVAAVRIEQGSGTLVDLGSGRWRFTPAADWSGAVVFGFTVSDAALSDGSTAALAVEPVDDAPVLSANSLVINQGAAVLVLRATDVDTAPEALDYGVLGSTGGHFELVDAVDQPIDRFSQADIDAGRVVFVPDASGRTPSFALSLSDGSTVLALQAPAVTTTPSVGVVPAAPLSAVEPTPVSVAASEQAVAPKAEPVAADAPVVIRATASPAPEPARATVDESTSAAAAPTNRQASSASVVRTSSSEVAVAGVDLRQLLAAEGAADMRGPALSYEWLDARTRAALAAALDRMHDEMQGEQDLDSITVAGSTAIGTGLSVGYVLWLARGGVLVASLMSSVPAWASVDPLPVLSQMRRDEDGDDADSEIDPVERLFDRARRLVRRDTAEGPTPDAAPVRAATPEEGA